MIFLKAELTRLPHDGAPKNTANQGPVIDPNHHVLCDPDSTGGSMIPRISLASPRRPRANRAPVAQHQLVWLWLIVNDCKFLSEIVFFSHTNQPTVLLHEPEPSEVLDAARRLVTRRGSSRSIRPEAEAPRARASGFSGSVEVSFCR